jgi:hypothetical protein
VTFARRQTPGSRHHNFIASYFFAGVFDLSHHDSNFVASANADPRAVLGVVVAVKVKALAAA